MRKFAVGVEPGIEVDACDEHGTWLDRGELAQLGLGDTTRASDRPAPEYPTQRLEDMAQALRAAGWRVEPPGDDD